MQARDVRSPADCRGFCLMSKVVAVVGASENRRKFGNKALRAFRKRGFTVVPINPREPEVEGIRAYASVREVPGTIDFATFYVPPSIGEKLIADMAERGITEVWLNPGTESVGLIRKAKTLGVKTVFGCSIIAIGEHPSSY
jgi:uncharacterized protein